MCTLNSSNYSWERIVQHNYYILWWFPLSFDFRPAIEELKWIPLKGVVVYCPTKNDYNQSIVWSYKFKDFQPRKYYESPESLVTFWIQFVKWNHYCWVLGTKSPSYQFSMLIFPVFFFILHVHLASSLLRQSWPK